MAAYEYQSLDTVHNEIRIVRFADSSPERPDVVRLTLHNVSLDDLSPGFSAFLGQQEPFDNAVDPQNSRYWYYWSDRFAGLNPPSPLVVASWRDYGYVRGERGVLSPVVPRFLWGEFEALSYCWKSVVRDKSIFLDGKIFHVTSNVEAMLQQLQQLPEAQTGMGFWIDGICINQDDTVEKSHQVGMMKNIYLQAFSTIIWLGACDSSRSRAIDAINHISGSITRPEANSISAADWCSILDIFSLEYFKRMWIIQELAINATDRSFFMCGDRTFERSAVQAACNLAEFEAAYISHLVSEEDYKRAVSIDQSYVWRTASRINRLVSRTLESTSSRELGIDTLFDLARKANATDVRDKVYGLLGLLPDALACDVKPDYSKSKEAVFQEFAVVILQHCERLDGLLAWCELPVSDVLPSWVPDWTQKFERYHVRWLRKRTAGGTHPPLWSLSDDVKRLNVKGALIDLIEHVSLPSTNGRPYGESRPHTQDNDVCPTYGRYNDRDGLRRAVTRALLNDHPGKREDRCILDLPWIDWNDGSSSHTWTDALNGLPELFDHWTRYDRFRQANADFMIFDQPFKELFPRKFELPERSMGKYSFREFERDQTEKHHGTIRGIAQNLDLFAVALQGRKLVTTYTGYIGLVPDRAEVGDVIAVLWGCNFPVILRLCQGGFRYVGECYIDGLMDGEGVKATERGDYVLKDICIV